MNRFSLLSLYQRLTSKNARIANRILASRLRKSKEDPVRLNERRGLHQTPRPEGALIWCHAASVGEALSALALGEALLKRHPSLSILITSGTRSAAEIIAKRLPARCFHAYSPLDLNKEWVQNFLNHWRPNVALWIESEFWPNLILETHARAIPMLIVNGRLSEKSYKKWRFARKPIAQMLACFEHAFVQNSATRHYLTALGMGGANVTQTPSLKGAAPALPYNQEHLGVLQSALQERPRWLAASTHEGEDEEMLIAHGLFCDSFKEALLILVPRHPERGVALEQMCKAKGWRVGRRSLGEGITPKTQIYIADTLGEMGVWFRLAGMSFIGASLPKTIGGHNPYEPAQLGSAILHGPFVENFAEIYARLDEKGGARQVASGYALGQALLGMCDKQGKANRQAKAHVAKAHEVLAGERDATIAIARHILTYLEGKDESA